MHDRENVMIMQSSCCCGSPFEVGGTTTKGEGGKGGRVAEKKATIEVLI